MPIPDLNEHGLLPAGIHDCSFQELEARFGQNQWLPDPANGGRCEVLCPQRGRLCGRLATYLRALGRLGLGVEILVNGSFVTDKPDPNDIDLIVVLSKGHDFSHALTSQEYNLLSKRRLRESGFPFDLFVVANGSATCQTALRLFQQVRDREEPTKGLVRVKP